MSFLVYVTLSFLISRIHAYPAARLNFSAAQDTIDLSYPLNANTIYWPEAEQAGLQFRRQPDDVWKSGGKPGVMYRNGHFSSSEHGGTHIDSPWHFYRKGLDVSELTLDQLCGPVAVIDVAAKCQENLNHQTNLEDIQAFEKRHGFIENGSFVLMRSGWGSRVPSKEKFFNTDDIFNISSLQFPGWHPDAVDWLIKNRDIRGVGNDAISVDNADENQGTFRTHLVLAIAGRIGIENVAKMEALPPTGAQIMVMPMKISEGTGAPARIFAILPAEMRDRTAMSTGITPRVVTSDNANVHATTTAKSGVKE